MKLGKLPHRHDPRTLRLAKYLPAVLPDPPEPFAWSPRVPSWPMLKNDDVGDCTVAGALHLEQVWTAANGRAYNPTDTEAISAYSAITGYRPGDDSTDNGAVLLDVLNYWRAHGIGGHRISAFAQVDAADPIHVMTAIWLFGGLYIGLELPTSCQDQTLWNCTDYRDGDRAPGSWGGHCVILTDYDAQGLTCITWGAKKRLTWGFLDTYSDEAWAIISPDFLNAQAQSPALFNREQLLADLARI
jgi:hypothetical protein